MASTRIIEQDHGTYAGLVTHHHHNGCYAGDFSGRGTVCGSVDIASRAGLAGNPSPSTEFTPRRASGMVPPLIAGLCRSPPRKRRTRGMRRRSLPPRNAYRGVGTPPTPAWTRAQ